MEQARLQEDLGYVRDVVRRSEAVTPPRAIWYLWAAIGAVGFALMDFAPAVIAPYWSIAAPAGFVLSAWLGWRHGRATGQESLREGRSHLLHWGGLLVTVFLLVPLAARGALQGETLGQVILLVIALGYFLAGVHRYRPLLWVGLLMAAGYGATFLVDRYVWTGVGLLVAVGLIVTARATGSDGAWR